jgi:phosphatidylglycerol:prolipoprotein diacylglycerol transferase
VHPTQLYETAIMLFVFWLLWRWRKRSHGTGWLFGVYLLLAGAERFLIEFIRAKDDRFLGQFTLAQAAALGVIVLGVVLTTQFGKMGTVSVHQVKALQPDSAAARAKSAS